MFTRVYRLLAPTLSRVSQWSAPTCRAHSSVQSCFRRFARSPPSRTTSPTGDSAAARRCRWLSGFPRSSCLGDDRTLRLAAAKRRITGTDGILFVRRRAPSFLYLSKLRSLLYSERLDRPRRSSHGAIESISRLLLSAEIFVVNVSLIRLDVVTHEWWFSSLKFEPSRTSFDCPGWGDSTRDYARARHRRRSGNAPFGRALSSRARPPPPRRCRRRRLSRPPPPLPVVPRVAPRRLHAHPSAAKRAPPPSHS